MVCYGKPSLSDIPIRNNQAASEWSSAKFPSKWQKKDWILAMLVWEVWDVTPSCWKYPTESSSSSNWFTKVLKISTYAERRIRQETGWLAGGPLLHVATIRCTTDTLLFISHTTNILLFKFHCNIFVGVRIIKEIPGSVASGTPCIMYNNPLFFQ